MKGANGTGRQRRRRGSGNPVAQKTSNFLELTKCRRRHFAVKKFDFAYDLGRGQNLRRSHLSEHSGFCSVVRFRWAGHRVQLRAFETRAFPLRDSTGQKIFLVSARARPIFGARGRRQVQKNISRGKLFFLSAGF